VRALVIALALLVALPAFADDEPYHRAFVALAEGRLDAARAELSRWLAENPSSPDRAHVEALLARMRPQVDEREDEVAPGGVERETAFARVEIAVGATMLGIGAGVEICLLVGCYDDDIVFLLPALSAGAGLATGLLLTRDGITPGHASAITSGALWGVWIASSTAAITESDDEKAFGALFLTGQLAGVALGELAWRLTGADAGQIATANSVGLWAGLMTGWSFGAFGDDDADVRPVVGTALAVSLVGLAGGAFLASRYPMSRGRVLTIDALGVVGGLLGVGTAFLAGGDDTSDRTVFRAVLPGVIVGLAVGTFVTRNWDLPARAPAIGFVPARGGGSLVLGGTF
jgi:hypothetical protein